MNAEVENDDKYYEKIYESKHDDLAYDERIDKIMGTVPPKGICEECGQECLAIRLDDGIGPYEFWGFKGVDHDYYWGSPCCSAKLIEGGNSLLQTRVVKAKKQYKEENIEEGEQYIKETWRYWRKNGPSWIIIKRKKKNCSRQ